MVPPLQVNFPSIDQSVVSLKGQIPHQLNNRVSFVVCSFFCRRAQQWTKHGRGLDTAWVPNPQGPCGTIGLQRAQMKRDLSLHSVVEEDLRDRHLSSLICPCSSVSLHKTQCRRERREGPVCPWAQVLRRFSSREMQVTRTSQTIY